MWHDESASIQIAHFIKLRVRFFLLRINKTKFIWIDEQIFALEFLENENNN